MRPASREMAKSLLAKGKSICICPGGVREVMETRKDKEVIILTRRTGFVKLALEHGCVRGFPGCELLGCRSVDGYMAC